MGPKHVIMQSGSPDSFGDNERQALAPPPYCNQSRWQISPIEKPKAAMLPHELSTLILGYTTNSEEWISEMYDCLELK